MRPSGIPRASPTPTPTSLTDAYAAAGGEPIDPFVTGMFAVIIGIGVVLLGLGLWPSTCTAFKARPARM